MSNFFVENVKSATARRQSTYISDPGRYLFQVKDLVMGKNRKGRDFIAVEFIVLDSDDKSNHPRGAERTWLMMLDADTAAKNFRGFLCNALDITDSSLTANMIDRAFARDENTNRSCLAGIKVVALARNTKTKAGNDFTLIDWRSAGEDAESLD